VYSSIYCKQIDALLATKRIALKPGFFCNMRASVEKVILSIVHYLSDIMTFEFRRPSKSQ